MGRGEKKREWVEMLTAISKTSCEMKLESIIEKLDKFCILHNIFMISE